ncbi:MAG: hypothetical protein ACLRZG_11000 [Streptococcus sp.]
MASMGLGYSLFEQGVQLQLGRSLEHLPHPLLKDLKAVYEPSLDYIFFKIPIFSDLSLKMPASIPKFTLMGQFMDLERESMKLINKP